MSGYAVYVTPRALAEIRELPGHVRQRARRAIDGLASEPRSARSKSLSLADDASELRRIRQDRWRIVYLLSDTDRVIDVVAVRRRPPYDYGDIEELLASVA
jgi:mRNA interferase RelE/StbE